MTRSCESQPDPVAVRTELRRILDSSFIPEGSIPAKILTFVVERTLAGEGRTIKAYTIAVEALGRAPDFDPDRDSTVRVAAVRLRAALELYYSGPGATNPLRIRMVPGSYRPTFETAAPDKLGCGLPASEPIVTVPPSAFAKAARTLASTRTMLLVLTGMVGINLVVTLSLVAVQVGGRDNPLWPQTAAAHHLIIRSAFEPVSD